MSPASSTKPLPKHPAVWWSRIKFRWPALVWLAAIVGAGWLYLSAGEYDSLSGVVEVIRENAAAVEPARLVSIAVQVGQNVRPGDTLAQLDTATLDAEIAALESEVALEQMQIDRQFSRAIIDAESALREARLRETSERAQLDSLNEELKRMESLLASRLMDAQSVARFKIERDTLHRSVQTYPETIRTLEQRLAEATNQQAAALGRLTPGSGVVAASQQRVNLLKLRKEGYTIRARRGGLVSQIRHLPGDVVPAGDPVVVTVVMDEQRFIGFVPEWRVYHWTVGDRARVFRRSAPTTFHRAHVVSVAPEIMALPGRVSPIQGQPVRGRRLVLVPDSPAEFIPGEEVIIDVEVPKWKGYVEWLDFLPATSRASQP